MRWPSRRRERWLRPPRHTPRRSRGRAPPRTSSNGTSMTPFSCLVRGSAVVDAGERAKPRLRVAVLRLTLAVPLEDLRFEAFEHSLAPLQPVTRLRAVRRVEPVAVLHAVEPRAELLELHPDLFGLLVRVVLAEVLELDLLDEVDLAVLDDLEVVLRCLVAEERDDLLRLLLVELAQRE